MDHLSGDTIVDILSTHPFVILKGELRVNKFYIPPERYLADLLSPSKGVYSARVTFRRSVMERIVH